MQVTNESYDYQRQVSDWNNTLIDIAFKEMKRLVETYENDAFKSNDDMYTELRLMQGSLSDIKGIHKLRRLIERD